MITLTSEHGTHDCFRDRLRSERIAQESVASLEAVEKSSAGVTLADDHGPDTRSLIGRCQLGSQAFVEAEGSSFRRAVVDHTGCRDIRCDRSDGDDHAVVGRDHGREELLDKTVVRQRVDPKCQAHVRLGRVQNCFPACEAGVVDEHSRLPEFASDGRCTGGDGRGRSDITLEIVDVGGRCALNQPNHTRSRHRWEAARLPSNVSGCMSSTATLTPCSDSSRTTMAPIPSLPPVMTTISLSQR